MKRNQRTATKRLRYNRNQLAGNGTIGETGRGGGERTGNKLQQQAMQAGRERGKHSARNVQESTCDRAVSPQRQQQGGGSTERTSRNQRATQRSIHTDSNKEEQVTERMCRNQHVTQQPIRQTATGSTEGMCRRNQHVARTAANQTDSNKQYRGDVQESTRDTAANQTDSNRQYRGDAQESTRDTYSSQSHRQQQAVQRGCAGINT